MQMELHTTPLKLGSIQKTFERLNKLGYNTVFLQYSDTFPFRRHKSLRGDFVYSRAQVRKINDMATEHGLNIIPLTHSFSHSDILLNRNKYVHLAESDAKSSLCLSNPESVDLMAELAEELLELHPRAEYIHIGGDEIAQVAACPACVSALWKCGRSGLFVEFLNKVADRFQALGVSPAVWSDMLIRFPESIDDLSRRFLIFYWDYWSSGERQPFLTIGGGFGDMIVLDKSAIQGDFAVMVNFPSIRMLHDVPQGLAKLYRPYWELDKKEKSAKSFPYLKFFTDRKFNVLAAALPYVELGSILPNYEEKWSHLTTAVNRIHETGAAGGNLCHWTPHWPAFETLWLGISIFAEGLKTPTINRKKVFNDYAQLVIGRPASDFADAVFHVSRRFELGDTLTPFWQVLPLEQKMQWHRDSGLLEQEIKNVKFIAKQIPRHLKVFQKYARDSPHAKLFAVLSEEILLKLDYERCLIKKRPITSALLKRLHLVIKSLRAVLNEYYIPEAVEKVLRLRFEPYLSKGRRMPKVSTSILTTAKG